MIPTIDEKGFEMSENNILVAYATTSGSTREIAEYVSGELAGMGQPVVLRPCREVTDFKEYCAVVIGAPLYMFHLHKDAVRFLRRHQKRLVHLPVAVFAGGPYGPNTEKDAQGVRKNLDAELAKFTWLRPVSVQLVGGRFDPARLRFPYNLIPALKQAPASDARDWAEIRAWACHLPGLFAAAQSLSAAERRNA
jgi:menaquinone-dependent protoporphyrinogen oxidase